MTTERSFGHNIYLMSADTDQALVPAPPEPARSDAKQALLLRLKAVFVTHGYTGASLSRLAAASGLGKASLYHHFPGGKEEIAGTLLRDAVGELQQHVFAPILVATDAPLKRGDAARRLRRTIERFTDYVDRGESHCLLALFAQEGAPGVNHHALREQFERWRWGLAHCYEATGRKPKAARRAAADLLNALYGSLLLARALHDPRQLRQSAKRLLNQIEAP